MGKKYIYIRVSTEKQDFAQQMECIRSYFARMGIDPASIDDIVKEKASGTIDASERKISDLLDICKSGDTIFTSELSRLSRSVSDTFKIVDLCCKRDINLIQCKDGTQIENKSIAGKAILFGLSLAAEIEVQNTRQRTKMGLSARREKLNKEGSFISKSGRVCTHFGREKGCDNTKANIASAISREIKAKEWRNDSVCYQTVKRWVSEGRSSKFVLSEINELYKSNPKVFSTRTGLPLSLSTLKRWRVEINEEIKEEISKQKR